MGEISVIPPRNREHSDKVECDGHGHGGPTPSHPNNTQAHGMDGDDGDTTEPVHFWWSLDLHMFKSGPGVDPAKEGEEEILRFRRMQCTHVGHSITSRSGSGLRRE